MNYKTLIRYYGTQSEAARAIDTDRQMVFNWGKAGRIPLDKQVLYEAATQGELKADLPQYFRRQAA
jgi:hypothetical protein